VSNETLTITDNRTGKKYELPITDNTIRANDLRQIKVADDDFGLMTYDPSFMSTAAAISLSSMVTKAFCAIAAIRLSNWLKSLLSWKLPIC
jgi:hypothetical protein